MKYRNRSLYSLAEWKNGLAFRNIHFSPSGKPVIKIAELKNGITGQTQFTQQTFDDSVALYSGDMLFSWSGNPDTSIDVFWYDLPDGWLNQHIFKVTPVPGVDRLYLFYLLKYLKPQFKAIASNKQTTGLGHVTVRDLKEMTVALPDIDIQKAIGEFLDVFDEKIRTNSQINDNLYEMVNSYYASLFKGAERKMTTIGHYAGHIYSGGTPTTSNDSYWNGTFGWLSSGETRNQFVISTEKTSEYSGKEFQINNIYASVDDFCHHIKYLRSFSFVQVDNLFTKESDIFKQVSDMWGLDAPSRVQMKISYGDVPVHRGKALIERLYRDKNEFENVVVIGCDDSGMEQTFDFSSVIRHIEISPNRDRDERYNPTEVKKLLLEQLR